MAVSTPIRTHRASPEKIMEMLGGYERSAVIKTAIDLELFTAIAEGRETAAAIAERCGAAEKGARVICDYLVTCELLTKSGDRYGLTDDSAAFLDKRSPTYFGSVSNFLLSPYLRDSFDRLSDSVRAGGAAESSGLDPEHPMWVEFARSMVPMIMPAAQGLAARLPSGLHKVLDIAAGHGMFGIAVAQRHPGARIVAVDWRNVLEYAKENAARMGLGDRFETIAGSAFEVNFGSDYDAVLLPNFLHHFNRVTNEGLLRKVHAALRPGGIVAITEFVPNDDRVSPPWQAQFAVKMLAETPSGDAYTMREYTQMLESAGFSGVDRSELEPTPQSLITAKK